MSDRFIGILGIALAIVGLVVPFRWHSMPPWLTTLLLCVATTMIGWASAMEWGAPHPKPVLDTSIFLQFPDSHTVPKAVSLKNIRYWYALYTESIYVSTFDEKKNPTGGFQVPPRWTVFLLFDKPASYRQMIARCSGPNNPKCDVQYSNAWYAIITMIGDTSLANMEVTAIPPEE